MRVNIYHLKNLFKCILKGFTNNWGLWKHNISIRPTDVLIKIKYSFGTLFRFTAIFIVSRIDIIGFGRI
jgi:hypothetical protein